MDWSPPSWRTRPITQQPDYANAEEVECVLEQVRELPPLVQISDIDGLKAQIIACQNNEAFLLQGGDCAESFENGSISSVQGQYKLLLQMSLLISHFTRKPVVKVGRIAGQFAKPRSSNYELIDGKQVYSYKGDNVNGYPIHERTPNPQRLLQAYYHSATTLTHIQQASLQCKSMVEPASWHLEALSMSLQTEMESAIRLPEAPQLDPTLYVSHEGLLLNYEEAQTHQNYNTAAHFLWIGERTRQLDGAHVEYFRGISNPIGVKVSSTLSPADLQALVLLLNPRFEPGRLTLITRYGASHVACLKEHVEAIQAIQMPVLWVCDPCHGNTQVVQGKKTRNYETMLEELLACVRIHQTCASHLGGVHLELTAEDVVECVGGPSEEDWSKYTTLCDPRLNYTQSLALAWSLGEALGELHAG